MKERVIEGKTSPKVYEMNVDVGGESVNEAGGVCYLNAIAVVDV
jgi:hypothetical protein